MSCNDLSKEIMELNLSYFLLAQKAINEDADLAKYRLRISDNVMKFIAGLSVAQIMEISSTNQFLFGICDADLNALEVILDSRKNNGLKKIQSAITINSNPHAEQVSS